MKIRLVEPKPPGVNVFAMSRLPRLGLPLLGALLREQGHDVKIYAEVLAPIDWADLARADLVGCSTTTSTAPAAYRIADWCRRKGITTIGGGSHVTFAAGEALAHFDLVVRGEGHRTMLEVVAAIERGASAGGIAGLSYRDRDGSERHNADREACSAAEFAALPAPDLSLIAGSERMTNIPVMTQWGCPFDCEFCSVIKMFGRRVRRRPAAAVLDEIAAHADRAKPIFFYDDNFVVDRTRTRELLRGMIERGLARSWSAQVRAEVVYADKKSRTPDHELLALMRDSGCKVVYCGFESVNADALRAYNKGQDVGTIRDAVRLFHRYGIAVHGMFVLGADADDAHAPDRTVSFALANEIDTVQLMILTPFPGTTLRERMLAEGRVLTNDWVKYDGHHCVIRPSRMTPYELQVATYRGMARFYSARRSLVLLLRRTLESLPRPARLPGALRLPVVRLVALALIRRWARQAASRAYVRKLRALMRAQVKTAGG